MVINKIERLMTVKDLVENSNWEIDKEPEHQVFKGHSQLKNCFEHFFEHLFDKSVYALSYVDHCDYENKLKIGLFEVNKPFRNKGIGRFALYELLKQYPTITNVELDSLSPESDKFFESLKMQREINKFTGDATWLSNFTTSMTNENKNAIIKIIESICNRLSNEAL